MSTEKAKKARALIAQQYATLRVSGQKVDSKVLFLFSFSLFFLLKMKIGFYSFHRSFFFCLLKRFVNLAYCGGTRFNGWFLSLLSLSLFSSLFLFSISSFVSLSLSYFFLSQRTKFPYSTEAISFKRGR